MRNREDYKKHIDESLKFAESAVESISDNELKNRIVEIVFDKCCSPYHYFIQNEKQESIETKPTEKQINYAKQLGINDLENYSRQGLSEEIERALKSGKK